MVMVVVIRLGLTRSPPRYLAGNSNSGTVYARPRLEH